MRRVLGVDVPAVVRRALEVQLRHGAVREPPLPVGVGDDDQQVHVGGRRREPVGDRSADEDREDVVTRPETVNGAVDRRSVVVQHAVFLC